MIMVLVSRICESAGSSRSGQTEEGQFCLMTPSRVAARLVVEAPARGDRRLAGPLQLNLEREVFPSKDEIGRRRVLVVGDAMLDRYWFGTVERISPEAPVPIVRVDSEQERLGAAANVALNARTFGAGVTLLSMVGTDEPARSLRRLLQVQGIDAVLGQDDKLQTIVKLRVIGRTQQLLRVDFETEPDHEVLGQMTRHFIEQLPLHDVVVFSDYGKGGLTHIPQMIEHALASGKPVLVDPKGRDYERYRGATVITPNRAELAQVVGQWADEGDLRSRAEALRHRLGLEGLLLTRSEEGMSLFQADGVTSIPADAREVADVTGAGDTVIAVMAAMVACGQSLEQAMRVANRAGALVVAKFGTATVTYEELFG
jgi:rfaE bifunctional protein kinase chain/domain